jgi:hypothetical protein
MFGFPNISQTLGSKSHYHYYFQANESWLNCEHFFGDILYSSTRVKLVASLNLEFTNCKFIVFFLVLCCVHFFKFFPFYNNLRNKNKLYLLS